MSTIQSAAYSRSLPVPSQYGATGTGPLPIVTIFGAGRVGTALARALVASRYDVRIVGSGPANGIELIVNVLAPGAVPMDANPAVADADVVILAVPLHKLDTIDAELLTGKIVVDVMNYWEPIDGALPEFQHLNTITSRVISRHLAAASVVKAFNHIGYHDIETDRREPGDPDRRALAVAGDDHAAVALVMEMVHRIGFDAVNAGGLDESGILEAGGPVFGARLTRHTLKQHLS